MGLGLSQGLLCPHLNVKLQAELVKMEQMWYKWIFTARSTNVCSADRMSTVRQSVRLWIH